MRSELFARRLGYQDYTTIWRAMQAYTGQRDHNSQDEVWLLEHPPVFTLGLAGKREHLLAPGDIPVIMTDRGGQVTYHGPGQLVAYLLLDLKRRGLGVRQLVRKTESGVLHLLQEYGLVAATRSGAPGVYVENKKIASLGFRVRRGCCYHGISLNVAMDLEPFARINPCGYAGLEITQLQILNGPTDMEQVAADLLAHLTRQLQYDKLITLKTDRLPYS